MSSFFRPYEGKRPYVFISYSHRNSEQVLEILNILNAQKLRIWYDEGIPAGSDWPQNIADHMEDCAAVLFFRSATALKSPNCRSEIETAVIRKKPLLILPLDNAEADESWDGLLDPACLSSVPDLPGSEAMQYADAVQKWDRLGKSFYKSAAERIRFDLIGLVFAGLLFLLAAAGLLGLVTGHFDNLIGTETETVRTVEETTLPPETAAPIVPETLPSGAEENFPLTFPDDLQAKAIPAALGKNKGDKVLPSELSGITELHFCGTMYLVSTEDVSLSKERCVVGSSEVFTGPVSDLSLIGSAYYLQKLSLILEPLDELSDLRDLVLLEDLNLGGCEKLENIDTLPPLPSLSSLHLEYSGVRDLSPLMSQPALKTVTVSPDMLPLIIPENAGFTVYLLP